MKPMVSLDIRMIEDFRKQIIKIFEGVKFKEEIIDNNYHLRFEMKESTLALIRLNISSKPINKISNDYIININFIYSIDDQKLDRPFSYSMFDKNS